MRLSRSRSRASRCAKLVYRVWRLARPRVLQMWLEVRRGAAPG